MQNKKEILKSEIIDGISVTYEVESGHAYAVAHCPYNCGHKDGSLQLSMDTGKIMASKIKTHMAQCRLRPI